MKYLYTFFAFILSLGLLAQPTTNAPDPDKDAANVVSVFSDFYTTNIATNFDPGWGQSGTVDHQFNISGSDNNILFYGSKDYQGTELTATNLSAYEYLHVDIWVAADADRQVKITPIDGTADALVPITLTPGSWSSVDIPKSDFLAVHAQNWNNVIQLKVDAQFNADGTAQTTTGIDIYFDNIYFWKNPSNDATDATLSDLTVDGKTVNGFQSATTSYTVDFPMGTTTIPTVAATANITGATVAVTQASAIPGDATVLVTATDGSTTKTYTVSFIENAPSTVAPAPPARAASDVASIMSADYAEFQWAEYFPNWGIGTVTNYFIGTDKIWKVAGFEKIAVANYNAPFFDLTGMDKVHLDLWTMGPNNPGDKITLEIVTSGGNADGFMKEIVTIAGGNQWQSVDIDLSAEVANANLTEVIQVILFANTNKQETVYFDNFYFYKEATASIENADLIGLKLYPNPVKNIANFSANETIQSVSIYDLTGRIVKQATPNKANFDLDVADLSEGVYLVKLSAGDIEATTKLIK